MLLEPAHRHALWREDRPKNWSYADVRAHVDSLLGLQLAAVFPNLDLHKLFGVLANDCAGLRMLATMLALRMRDVPRASLLVVLLVDGWNMLPSHFAHSAATVIS